RSCDGEPRDVADTNHSHSRGGRARLVRFRNLFWTDLRIIPFGTPRATQRSSCAPGGFYPRANVFWGFAVAAACRRARAIVPERDATDAEAIRTIDPTRRLELMTR